MNELPQFIKESWIGRFIDFASPLSTPEIFKRWAAVAACIGALERRVWVCTAGTTLYPSHYIILVSPPGVGKSMIIKEVQKFWISTNTLKISPDSATKAAMVDFLAKARRTYTHNGDHVVFHSVQIATTEFGTLINSYDPTTINFYNRIWDCEDTHRENTRYGENKEITIDYPQINMLAGTQPAYLGLILPPEAFGMGFTARFVLVYSAQAVRPKLFTEDKGLNEIKRKELIKEMREMVKMCGEMTYTPDAKEFLSEWYDRNDDAPEHLQLEPYNVRRIVTIQKVSMGIAAARGSMQIDADTCRFALALMHEAEAVMSQVFRGMKVPDSSKVMAELFTFAVNTWNKWERKRPIPEHLLVDFLKDRIELFKINNMLEMMVKGNKLREVSVPQTSGTFTITAKHYIPVG